MKAGKKKETPAREEPLLAFITEGDGAPEDPGPHKLLKGKAFPVRASESGREDVAKDPRKGPTALLRLLGPGLVTGASDDDPSGIGTASQVGSQLGYGLLWSTFFTIPMMIGVQEMCARIALQTGAGLGVTLRKKFPAWIVVIAVLALFVANSFNLGADLGAIAAGGDLLAGGRIPRIWLVVLAGVVIGGLQLFASYEMIFKVFKYLTFALFAYVIGVFVVHPNVLLLVKNTFIPNFQLKGAYVTGLVALLGTSISPYLFFWQAASEVDEMKSHGKVTRKQRRGVGKPELRVARWDIAIGMVISQAVTWAIIATSAATLNAHGITNVQSATEAARALQPLAGTFAFLLFALGMIGTGMLAIPVLASSAAYALKEVFGFRGDLAAKPRYRPTFYGLIVLAMLIGLVLNFTGINPISALFISSVLNGILAPPLLILITLLASDRGIMGKRVSGRLSRVVCWITTGLMGICVLGLVFQFH